VESVDGDAFSVALIPETLARTTLGHKRAGALVNVEVDVLAKYVEKLLVTKGDMP
jgi:riboflavin synthase